MGVKSHTGWLRTYSNEFFAPKTFSSLILLPDGGSYASYVEGRFSLLKDDIKAKPGKIIRNYEQTEAEYVITAEIFNDLRAVTTKYVTSLTGDDKKFAEDLGVTQVPEGNTVNNAFTHAEGQGTAATESAAHTEGKWTQATKSAAHAEGIGTKAYSIAGHAEGFGTKAGMTEGENINTCYGAHAEGVKTEANGRAAHTEGENTYAVAYAHAEGLNSRAENEYAHAEGYGTITATNGQHVQGRFNKADSKQAHIIGAGSANDIRRNIHTVDWEGNSWYNGSMEIEGDMDIGQRLIGVANETGRNRGAFGTSLPTTNLTEGQIFFLIIEEENT